MTTSISVSRGGVQVHKTVLAEEGPMPMVAYVLTTGRERPVAVRLLEQLPERVDRADVGLHDDYGGENWQVGLDGVEFEATLDPGERVRTGFFVDCAPGTADAFYVAPSVEDVRPVEATATQ